MRTIHHVYILGSHGGTLYTGRTTNLDRRLIQHRSGAIAGFTKRYRIHKLLHVEEFTTARDAAQREHQIKRWSRAKRVALIEEHNPHWDDLASSLPAGQPPSVDGRFVQDRPGPSLRSGRGARSG